MEKAIFAAGCFWEAAAVFGKIDGVDSVTLGYIGGNAPNPRDREVCCGFTGHVEAIEIEFDPKVISYLDLLDFFWINHDPTTVNFLDQELYSQHNSAIYFLKIQRIQKRSII